MGVVKAFKIDGLEMFMYSGDHDPPHFHVRRPGVWRAKVCFLESEADMIKCVKPPGADIRRKYRKALLNAVRDNRHQLLREWEQAQE